MEVLVVAVSSKLKSVHRSDISSFSISLYMFGNFGKSLCICLGALGKGVFMTTSPTRRNLMQVAPEKKLKRRKEGERSDGREKKKNWQKECAVCRTPG